jgi:hypothetical protein
MKIVTLKAIPTDAVKVFVTGINNEFFISASTFTLNISLSLSPVSSYTQSE